MCVCVCVCVCVSKMEIKNYLDYLDNLDNGQKISIYLDKEYQVDNGNPN